MSKHDYHDPHHGLREMYHDLEIAAFDRVERLRTALTEICRIKDVNTPQGTWRADLQEIARRALERDERP